MDEPLGEDEILASGNQGSGGVLSPFSFVGAGMGVCPCSRGKAKGKGQGQASHGMPFPYTRLGVFEPQVISVEPRKIKRKCLPEPVAQRQGGFQLQAVEL